LKTKPKHNNIKTGNNERQTHTHKHATQRNTQTRSFLIPTRPYLNAHAHASERKHTTSNTERPWSIDGYSNPPTDLHTDQQPQQPKMNKHKNPELARGSKGNESTPWESSFLASSRDTRNSPV
jgi:hypothetical protein